MSHDRFKITALACALLGATALVPVWAQSSPSKPAAAAPQNSLSAEPDSANAQMATGSSAPATPSTGVVVADPAKKASDADKSDKGADKASDSKASDRQAFFEAHLAALHAGLALTPDQEKLWPALEQSIQMFSSVKSTDGAGDKAVLDPESDDQTETASGGSDKTDNRLDSFEAVKAAGTLLLERGKALQSLADSAEPLYRTLTPEQKRRLPVLVRGFSPNNMRLRRFLALMTWDAQPERTRSEHRSDADRSGSRDWSDRDGQEERSPMRHGWRHWKDRDRASDTDDEMEPRSMRGYADGRDGDDSYGNSNRQRYRYDPYDSDD